MWAPIMILHLDKGQRLMSYLRDHHHEKWVALTTFAGFGPGWKNGFRSVPWLLSKDTLNDPIVASLKSDHRRFLFWVFAVFLTFPIFTIAFNTFDAPADTIILTSPAFYMGRGVRKKGMKRIIVRIYDRGNRDVLLLDEDEFNRRVALQKPRTDL
jgi:hypothetical protein